MTRLKQIQKLFGKVASERIVKTCRDTPRTVARTEVFVFNITFYILCIRQTGAIARLLSFYQIPKTFQLKRFFFSIVADV